MKIKTQEISLLILKEKKVRLFIKRIDQIHPILSGNKWYKLKYNLLEAKKMNLKTVLTFGGAYSNHISATAFAAKNNGFRSIGIIRGEKHLSLNPTLRFAVENNMELHYVSRSDYRKKSNIDFIDDLRIRFGKFYLIPEGGTNNLSIKGASEILTADDLHDYVCCPVGTGGTLAGLVNSTSSLQKVIGFSVIKNYNSLEDDIKRWVDKENYRVINDYNLGGYAKFSKELIQFINNFYLTHNIPLDLIYTGKMVMGVLDLVEKDYFEKGSTILVIHTGGLQGNKGFSERLGIILPS